MEETDLPQPVCARARELTCGLSAIAIPSAYSHLLGISEQLSWKWVKKKKQLVLVPSPVLSSLLVLTHLILTTALGVRYYYHPIL